mgnify:CR=1 FL=1
MRLTCMLIGWAAIASTAVAAPSSEIVGDWKRLTLPGVAGFERLTFTPDGRLLAEERQFLGKYEVKGRRVTTRTSFGESYVYELTDDGRLCVFPGPGMMLAASERDTKLLGGQCFSKAAKSS